MSSYVTTEPDGSREVDVQSLFYDQIEMVRRIARMDLFKSDIAESAKERMLQRDIGAASDALAAEHAALIAAQQRIAELDAERDRLIDELRDAEARNAQKLAEIARLREALDFYACIDHYPGGAEPYVVPHDYGQKARAALESGDE